MKTFFVVIAALLSCALARQAGCPPQPTEDICAGLDEALNTLVTTIPACVPEDLVEDDGTPQFPDCSFDSIVDEVS